MKSGNPGCFSVSMLLFCFLVFALPARAFDRDYREKINGTTLHFRVRGEKTSNPYLLILHGGPGFSAHMFYPWGKSIEKSLNVVYLDQRGCGESDRLKVESALSPKPEEIKDYTIPNLLADIEGVRQFLHVSKWYVLGHSWGGMLGLEYVTANPASMLGYIHVDGLLSQPMAQEAIIDFAEKRIALDEKSSDAEKQARAKRLKPFVPYARNLPAGRDRLFSSLQFAMALFGDIYYADAKQGTAYNAKVADALKPYNVPLSAISPANEPAVALIQNENYAKRDDTALLAKVTCKTLVINGKQDGLITSACAETVQKGIKGSKLILLDNCGHFPFAEQPEAFTLAITAFIAP